jgi:lipopolysaccharide/colanic/teichoic acid biosynthesis glycosyltransferase
VFDIVVATIGLIVTAPFVAIAAVLIKLESEGPVFFRQERVGRHGIMFDIIKLRSMYGDAERRRGDLLDQNESDGPLFKMRHDPRVTRVGRVLRVLSIDEFPQFWNPDRRQDLRRRPAASRSELAASRVTSVGSCRDVPRGLTLHP